MTRPSQVTTKNAGSFLSEGQILALCRTFASFFQRISGTLFERVKLFFPLLLLLYGSIRAFPQTTEPESAPGTLTISGLVKDAGDSKPLSGATIEISGSKR